MNDIVEALVFVGIVAFLYFTRPIIRYRITGYAAIKRLTPLLQKIHSNAKWVLATSPDEKIDFVFETTCEKSWKKAHMSSKYRNIIAGTRVLENKADLAILLSHSGAPCLATVIFTSTHKILEWAENRWQNNVLTITNRHPKDWWMLKASAGNGGRDVFLFHKLNYRSIVSCGKINSNELYILQEYAPNPLLYTLANSTQVKYHFRCYILVLSSLETYLYSHAFILTASTPYSIDNDADDEKKNDDDCMHISNLSVNKHVNGYPGQIVTDLEGTEYYKLFDKMKHSTGALMTSSQACLKYQSSSDHYEHFGLDFIACHGCNDDDDVYLLEVNKLPGLTSSKSNQVKEDEFYNGMMVNMMKIVMNGRSKRSGCDRAVVGDARWVKVKDAADDDDVVVYDEKQVYKNVLAAKSMAIASRRSNCLVLVV